MNPVHVSGVGLVAPGLEDWTSSLPMLKGERAYVAGELTPHRPTLLAANERRRTTRTINLALQVALQSLHAGIDRRSLASVFASSEGDTGVLDRTCIALNLPGRPVSPIQFHNSVHNAPAAYWSIGIGSTAPSTSICAFDASFSAGLLEAATLTLVERRPVLLVAYDHVPPPALGTHCPVQAPFAAALLLGPERTPESRFALVLDLADAGRADTCGDPGLETLRRSNPIARSLPLLQAMARGSRRQVRLPYVADRILSAELTPC